MVRNIVAGAFLAVAGTVLSVSEPALAGPRGGAMPAFRPAMMPHVAARPQVFFRGAPRSAPGAFGHRRQAHIPPSPRAYGTINPPTRPYGTVAASRPYGTVGNPTPRFGRITLAHPRSHLTRRHHRGYHLGWGNYPLTVGGEFAYFGIPYDPAERIPVYGPAPEAEPLLRPEPAAARMPAPEGEPCRSERVIVPAAEGEREITVVRCGRVANR